MFSKKKASNSAGVASPVGSGTLAAKWLLSRGQRREIALLERYFPSIPIVSTTSGSFQCNCVFCGDSWLDIGTQESMNEQAFFRILQEPLGQKEKRAERKRKRNASWTFAETKDAVTSIKSVGGWWAL